MKETQNQEGKAVSNHGFYAQLQSKETKSCTLVFAKTQKELLKAMDAEKDQNDVISVFKGKKLEVKETKAFVLS